MYVSSPMSVVAPALGFGLERLRVGLERLRVGLARLRPKTRRSVLISWTVERRLPSCLPTLASVNATFASASATFAFASATPTLRCQRPTADQDRLGGLDRLLPAEGPASEHPFSRVLQWVHEGTRACDSGVLRGGGDSGALCIHQHAVAVVAESLPSLLLSGLLGFPCASALCRGEAVQGGNVLRAGGSVDVGVESLGDDVFLCLVEFSTEVLLDPPVRWLESLGVVFLDQTVDCVSEAGCRR